MEKGSERVRRMTYGLENLLYNERLKKVNQLFLSKRRLTGVLNKFCKSSCEKEISESRQLFYLADKGTR